MDRARKHKQFPVLKQTVVSIPYSNSILNLFAVVA